MSEHFEVQAQVRSEEGKGASRRLRRTGLVPAIVYGGKQPPEMISLVHSDLLQRLEHESFYSSVINLKIGEQATQVVLKDLQRHPAKPFVIHVDFQRISSDEKLRMTVPIHFENEAVCVGVKKRGVVTHNMTEVEITCLPADLPEFIVVDMVAMDIGDTVHVSDLIMPAGVELTHAQEPETAVVSVQAGFGGAAEDDDEEGEAESAV